MSQDELVEVTILNFAPIGTLKFFYIQDFASYLRELPPLRHNNVYWKDAETPAGYGPFPTVYVALEHYKSTIIARKTDPPKAITPSGIPSNVVEVDFRKKK